MAHTVTGTTTHFSGFAPCGVPCALRGASPYMAATCGDIGAGCCVTVQQGGTATLEGEVEQENYIGSGTIVLDSLPNGLTGNADVGALQAGNCAVVCFKATLLRVTASTAIPPGLYDIVALTSTGGAGGVRDARAKVVVRVVAPAGYMLTLGTNAVSAAQGATISFPVTIARTNFTGPVSLNVTGAPGGVLPSLSTTSLNGSVLSSTLTLNVGSAVPAGTYNITVHGSAAGLTDQTQVVALTISAFSLAAVPGSVSLAPGANTTATITATRSSGFATPIAYTVSGLPTGLTAVVTPTGVADQSTLTITAGGALATGTYSATVTGTAGSVVQQVTIAISVASASGIRFDFSQCGTTPIWLAYQDGGTGSAWTRVNAAGTSFTIPTLTTGKGAIAWVAQGGSRFATFLKYATQAEFTANAASYACAFVPGSGISVGGIVNGIDAGNVYVSLGGQFTVATGGTGAYQLQGVASGPQDLIGYLLAAAPNGADDRVVVRRDQLASNGGTLAGLDMNGAGSAPVITAPFTVNNTLGDPTTLQMFYVTHGCEAGMMYNIPYTGASSVAFGMPATLQRTDDLYSLRASAQSADGFRSATTMFHAFGTQTVTVGGALSPAITSLPGPYKRLQATLTLPADYQDIEFSGNDPNGDIADVYQTGAYRGGSSVTLAMPDLSTAPGYLTAWGLPTGSSVFWTMNAESVRQRCGEGATSKAANTSGAN